MAWLALLAAACGVLVPVCGFRKHEAEIASIRARGGDAPESSEVTAATQHEAGYPAQGESLLAAGDQAATVAETSANACESFVPKSVSTSWQALPWVENCKCDVNSVLWGYGPACDSRNTNGFDAQRIFKENGQNIGACGCEGLTPLTAKVAGDQAATAAETSAAACESFVPKSVPTSFGGLPWVENCKCDVDSVLWGYGPACDSRSTNGFNAERIFEDNGQDVGACGCEGLTRQPAVETSADSCESFVPNSVPTTFKMLPWIAPCKCVDSILWGYGLACNPHSSGGFDAERIFKDNGNDMSACKCQTYSQSIPPQKETPLAAGDATR